MAWIDPWRGVPFDPSDPLKSMAIVKRAARMAQNDASPSTQLGGNSHQIAVKRPSNNAMPTQGRRNPADCPARYRLVPD